MYLIDTNVWLDRLLNGGEGSEEVRRFFDAVPSERLWITDLALQAIGGLLAGLDRMKVLASLCEDAFASGAVKVVGLKAEDLDRLTEVMRRLRLPFYHAYHYVAAEKFDLTIVSLDAIYDGTERGRLTPGAVASSFVSNAAARQ